MDISQLLTDWFSSEKSGVEPSFLAYVLLYLNKTSTGINDMLHLLANFWEKGDAMSRTKCIELLAQCLGPSQATLNASTNSAIIQFVGERLNDPTLIPRFIDILSIIMHSDSITGSVAIQICNLLFTIKVKKLPQQSRYKILIILAKVLEDYARETQRAKISFISGFINCMDGEKDPRNLMVAFELVRAIIDRFDISRHIEDLFDVVFCYFPISFQPHPSSNNNRHSNPFGVSTEDLKDSLRRCLAATPYFAYYATPLLIEKLLTTEGSAKKDAMETISLCAPAYGAHAILPHALNLFDALMKEVYGEVDPAMVNAALETIHNVVATLGTGITIANIRDPVEKAIDTLLTKCVEELKEPESKKARSAAYILRSAASASDPACTSVTHVALPIILQQYDVHSSVLRRKSVLDIMTELLIGSKKLYGSVEDVGYDRDFQTPFLMYKQQILQMYLLSLTDTNSTDVALRQASLKGIHEMVLMKQFLKGEEVHVVIDLLTQQLTGEDEKLRQLALSTFGIIAKLYPEDLSQRTFPILLEQLKAEHNYNTTDTYQFALNAVRTLGAHPAVFKIIVPTLLDKLNYACETIGHQNIAYVHDIASAMLHTYKGASKDCEISLIGQKTIVPTLFSKCIQSSMGSGTWYLDDFLVEVFAMMTAITTRLSSSSEQQVAVDDSYKCFVQGDLSKYGAHMNKGTSSVSFKPFQDITAVDITLLFTAIVGNCCKNVHLPLSDMPNFLQGLIQTALQTTSCAKRLALVKLAASIINKWINDDILNCIQRCISEHLSAALAASTRLEDRKTAFLLLIWIIKSLVVRAHKHGFELLDDVIKQCGCVDLGTEAAESFNILLKQDELVLNKASHATVSILFKQRVYNYCFRKLMNGAEAVDIRKPELKNNYLLAIVYILQNIPNQFAINESAKLMLPIIDALSSHDNNLIRATMKVAQQIVPEAQDLVVQHLGSLIHALLRLTQLETAVDIRISALLCLCEIAAKGKPANLSPFRPSVIQELAMALDDKKRVVRRNAVDCRERWFAIGKQ
ncbi:RNAPII transcription regulator C-terminal-domain-containing protein [Mycotypha africana]|uniref:RNAPII transcription regulator C-terminal-domain-containing protein n=1 Tax=Mycotypha africana TaxID=64632 RepID=UPI002301B441|nr:RNAPII transcription regulator C-terminal-domain-containing protein [Mycotypha africana]KAI8971440.1 RNAPII transcription regulator C-terminal-domain-containing protein [Mycotypha africana]